MPRKTAPGGATTPRQLRTTPAVRLKAARTAAGWTQAQLAEALACGVPYISDLETGRRNPSLEWLWEAARALQCDPASLDERLAPHKQERKYSEPRYPVKVTKVDRSKL